MVAGIVGPAGVLLNDDPFGIPRATAFFWIHIVLAIAPRWKKALTILKGAPSDIAWQGFAIADLEASQEVMRFLRRGLFMPNMWSSGRSIYGGRGDGRLRCLCPFGEPDGGGAMYWQSRKKRGKESPEDQDADDPSPTH
jgi:hypothetical protein